MNVSMDGEGPYFKGGKTMEKDYKEYESKEEVRDKPVVRCKACIKRFEVPLKTTSAECPTVKRNGASLGQSRAGLYSR